MSTAFQRFFANLGLSANRAPRRAAFHGQRKLRGFESLEDRKLMAHIAVLDFDGEEVSAVEMAQGGWKATWGAAVNSFNSLFTNDRMWLDLDRNGQVNNSDAQIAIDRITAKVREDYAPFDLQIVVGDQDAYQGRLTDSNRGDAIVVISGGQKILTSQDAMGLSPSTGDLGNERDEISWVFGAAVMSGSGAQGLQSADTLINAVARTTSHELGHCFGLGHITSAPDYWSEAAGHHLMGVDARDYSSDFTFEDLPFQTDVLAKGSLSRLHPEFNVAQQNAFQYLSNPAVLGPSTGTWAAMLQPGILTISGDATSNNISVAKTSYNEWTVSISSATSGQTRTARVLTSFPDWYSLNPYSAPIDSITIYGNAGNDTITGSNAISVQMFIYGGAGNDTLTGGGGRDFLYGGNDNDLLSGGKGIDHLFGELGDDSLMGDTYSTDDGVVDWLIGGGGRDIFYQPRRMDPFLPAALDYIYDFNATDDRTGQYEYSLSVN